MQIDLVFTGELSQGQDAAKLIIILHGQGLFRRGIAPLVDVKHVLKILARGLKGVVSSKLFSPGALIPPRYGF